METQASLGLHLPTHVPTVYKKDAIRENVHFLSVDSAWELGNTPLTEAWPPSGNLRGALCGWLPGTVYAEQAHKNTLQQKLKRL